MKTSNVKRILCGCLLFAATWPAFGQPATNPRLIIRAGSDPDTLRLQIELFDEFTNVQFKVRPALFDLCVNQITIGTGYSHLSFSTSPV